MRRGNGSLCAFPVGRRASRRSIRDKFSLGLLSCPCARMETEMGDFVLGVTLTLCALLVGGMMVSGPQILEWIEGTPREQG